MRRRLRRGLGLGAAATVLLASVPSAQAEDRTIDNLVIPSEADLQRSIQEIRLDVSDIDLTVRDLDLPRVSDVVIESDQKAVVLSSDVLFAFGSAKVAPSLAKRMPEVLREIPQGASVAIGGYTDSIGDAASNLKLSTDRAQAVAAVVRAARPDLKLQVKGYGEANPVAPNEVGGEDKPENREKNRRVELRVG